MSLPGEIYLMPKQGVGGQSDGVVDEWVSADVTSSDATTYVRKDIVDAERESQRSAFKAVLAGLNQCCGTICDRQELVDLINQCLGDEEASA